MWQVNKSRSIRPGLVRNSRLLRQVYPPGLSPVGPPSPDPATPHARPQAGNVRRTPRASVVLRMTGLVPSACWPTRTGRAPACSMDGPPLGEPQAVVRPDEPAVQLVPPALLGSKDALDQVPQRILVLVEQPGRLPPVGRGPVGGAPSLLDVGGSCPSRRSSSNRTRHRIPCRRERGGPRSRIRGALSHPACGYGELRTNPGDTQRLINHRMRHHQ